MQDMHLDTDPTFVIRCRSRRAWFVGVKNGSPDWSIKYSDATRYWTTEKLCHLDYTFLLSKGHDVAVVVRPGRLIT